MTTSGATVLDCGKAHAHDPRPNKQAQLISRKCTAKSVLV